MKNTTCIALAAILFIAGCFTRLAAQDNFNPDRDRMDSGVPTKGVTYANVPKAWSVIGEWHYSGPVWRGMIEIRDDGTFIRGGYGEAGKWKLAAVEDHFVLVLKWYRATADTVKLIGPDLFQAETADGDVIVRRLDKSATHHGN